MAAMLTRRKLRSARLDKTTEHYDDINISGDELTLSMRDYNNPTEGSSNQRRSLSAAQMQKVDGEASKTPVKQTPGSMVKQIQRHLETQNPASCETTGAIQQKAITPVLAQLKRGFSGSSLENVRTTLLHKHQEAKNRVDSLNVGGGISIWPEMNDMRLTNRDVVSLASAGILLCLATIFMFSVLHGQLLADLQTHWLAVTSIAREAPLVTDRDNASFTDSILSWHAQHKELVNAVHKTFDVSLVDAPPSYIVGVVVYVVSIALLLYYLADNVLAKSRLTPQRIKQWVLLLIVTATWTLLGLRLLVAAQQLESAVKNNVYTFNEHLGDLISQRFDLSTYHSVLTYWRTRCLLSTSPPLLSILGLVAVGDIYYYLQYYSLPVLSALVLPVVRLAWALAEIYRPHSSQT